MCSPLRNSFNHFLLFPMPNQITVIPRLPAKNLDETKEFFEIHLEFKTISIYPDYFMMEKEGAELHFFRYPDLDPLTNYSMVYLRLKKGIESLYSDFLQRNVPIHPNGSLELKPWGMMEFSILDPNHTLLTFGQEMDGLL